jgi:hypothetical protein
MPQNDAYAAIIVISVLAVLAFSLLVAWRIERKALSLTVEEYNDMCGYLNDTQTSNRTLTEQNEELGKRINRVKAFVKNRQVTCQNKKTGRFAPINDAELEKVMSGEEIA